jgi:predicted nucleotide-binding protein
MHEPLRWEGMESWIAKTRRFFLEWDAKRLKAFDDAARPRGDLWLEMGDADTRIRSQAQNHRVSDRVRVRLLALLDECVEAAKNELIAQIFTERDPMEPLASRLKSAKEELDALGSPPAWSDVSAWAAKTRFLVREADAESATSFDELCKAPKLPFFPRVVVSRPQRSPLDDMMPSSYLRQKEDEYRENQADLHETSRKERAHHGKILEAARKKIAAFLDGLIEHVERRGATPQIPAPPVVAKQHRILICHGHSRLWKDLRNLLTHELKLEFDEFNREPAAGVGHEERIREMLDRCDMAFLVMTAEDETTDGEMRARQNVVHELGRCQEKYGSRKAIILQEEGCTLPSNYDGRNAIRFPKGDLEASAEEIRRVLRREGMIE